LPWQPDVDQNRQQITHNSHNFSCTRYIHAQFGFWATVCKTVALSYGTVVLSVLSCLSCLTDLSVGDVGVLWPNGLLACQVSSWTNQDETRHASKPQPGHIVLDRNTAPPPKVAQPQLSAHICCAKWPDGSSCHLVRTTEIGLGPSDIVSDGDPAPPPPKKGRGPNFRPMSIVAKRLH